MEQIIQHKKSNTTYKVLDHIKTLSVYRDKVLYEYYVAECLSEQNSDVICIPLELVGSEYILK